MLYPTPLRYPGGKGKLTNFVKLLLLENNLLDGHYAEPFAGGAGVALSLLLQEYVIHIHINDLNKSIYSFWYSVLHETDELCRLINDVPLTMEEWRLQRSIQRDPDQVSTLELGFSTFFLNRTNRSGIIAAGPIGGQEQTGEWKLDARYNRIDLISRIKRIASYRSRISIYNLDATDFLLDTVQTMPDNTLVYLDPPYYVKGKDLYQNHYSHDDHAALARTVATSIRQNWMVSYDFVPQIAEMYNEFRQIDYLLSYSASARYKGSELMVFDDRLIIPDVVNPSKVKAA
jgi:DNA adenine methylase